MAKEGLITDKDIYIERREGTVLLNSDHLSESALGDDRSWMPGKTLNDIERNVIIEALKYHQGNRTHTAKALGISIRTLRNKLAEYRTIGIYL